MEDEGRCLFPDSLHIAMLSGPGPPPTGGTVTHQGGGSEQSWLLSSWFWQRRPAWNKEDVRQQSPIVRRKRVPYTGPGTPPLSPGVSPRLLQIIDEEAKLIAAPGGSSAAPRCCDQLCSTTCYAETGREQEQRTVLLPARTRPRPRMLNTKVVFDSALGNTSALFAGDVENQQNDFPLRDYPGGKRSWCSRLWRFSLFLFILLFISSLFLEGEAIAVADITGVPIRHDGLYHEQFFIPRTIPRTHPADFFQKARPVVGGSRRFSIRRPPLDEPGGPWRFITPPDEAARPSALQIRHRGFLGSLPLVGRFFKKKPPQNATLPDVTEMKPDLPDARMYVGRLPKRPDLTKRPGDWDLEAGPGTKKGMVDQLFDHTWYNYARPAKFPLEFSGDHMPENSKNWHGQALLQLDGGDFFGEGSFRSGGDVVHQRPVNRLWGSGPSSFFGLRERLRSSEGQNPAVFARRRAGSRPARHDLFFHGHAGESAATRHANRQFFKLAPISFLMNRARKKLGLTGAGGGEQFSSNGPPNMPPFPPSPALPAFPAAPLAPSIPASPPDKPLAPMPKFPTQDVRGHFCF